VSKTVEPSHVYIPEATSLCPFNGLQVPGSRVALCWSPAGGLEGALVMKWVREKIQIANQGRPEEGDPEATFNVLHSPLPLPWKEVSRTSWAPWAEARRPSASAFLILSGKDLLLSKPAFFFTTRTKENHRSPYCTLDRQSNLFN
jgi:hypothetical protein